MAHCSSSNVCITVVCAWILHTLYAVTPLTELKTSSEGAELFTTIIGDYQGCLQSDASKVSLVLLMKQLIFDLFDARN